MKYEGYMHEGTTQCAKCEGPVEGYRPPWRVGIPERVRAHRVYEWKDLIAPLKTGVLCEKCAPNTPAPQEDVIALGVPSDREMKFDREKRKREISLNALKRVLTMMAKQNPNAVIRWLEDKEAEDES